MALGRGAGAVARSGLFAVLFIACGSSDRTGPAEAKVIESRLLAPCCWTQTLDVHESPVAAALRDEIEARAAAGQAADRIEGDLVDRFGERIRVVPPGKNPRGMLGGGVAIAMAAVLVLLALRIRKWVRSARTRPTSLPASPRPSNVRDEYDEKLDDELAQLAQP